jgi:hypothetical protein
MRRRGTSTTLKTDAIEVLKVFDGLLINIRRVILYMATSTPIFQVINTFGYFLFEIEKEQLLSRR